jgi:ferric-dicitrate binding protein FerR (iron transport regulator)
METPERIWFLLSRTLSGDATEQDKEELYQLIQQHPELMQQFDMLQQLWPVNKVAREAEPLEEDKISRILQKAAIHIPANNTMPARVFHIKKWRKLYWAAAIITALTLGSWFFIEWNKNQQALAANEIVAPQGSKTRTILPDGSTVWLNAGSRIKYAGFDGPVREVTLEGEAFFDVMHLETVKGTKPFIVHAGNIDIKVLGTAFNVKSYPDEKTIETTLLRGLVQITRKGDQTGGPIYLHPNEKIVLPVAKSDGAPVAEKATGSTKDNSVAQHIIRIDSTLKENQFIETAWVYNRLEFHGDNFEQLARKLERWYNVKIYFEDNAARQLVFNGSLENETVEQAFIALKAAVPFNVTIRNNEIYIKSSN